MLPSHSPYRPLPPIPPPPFPRLFGAVVALVLCTLLAAYTTHKIHTMEMLRGERPGAPQRSMQVIPRNRPLGADTVEFFLFDPIANDSYRIQARAPQYARLRPGRTVVVRCLEDDHECFFRDSIYIDDGNMGFDHDLRVLEIVGLLGSFLWIAVALLRWRLEAVRHRKTSIPRRLA
jgi:hypothetical protein